MKTLGEYIRGNPDQFNTEEPHNGHFERFNEKLERLGKERNTYLLPLMRIAAMVLIGLVISYAVVREIKILRQETADIFPITEDPELMEAEQYYTTQLNLAYYKIQNLAFNDDQHEKKTVLRELNDMDKQVQAMKIDLKQNPDDERVVHAIINFYQVKIEMIDMIIARTQQFQNSVL
jgi:hypothetical protein